MEYQAPYGSSDPDAPYVDRNTPGALAGSKVPGPAIEHPQRELVALIAKSGGTPSSANLTLVAEAVRSQALNYRAAGGTPNALTVTLDPPLTAHVEGMPLRVEITAENTDAAALNAGPGFLPIKTLRGADIARGDLPVGARVTVICTGTAWMLASIAYSEVPIVGSPTIYVRTDGSDSNDGGANTAARALLTLQEAVNRLKNYFNTGDATIRLGIAGTYASWTTLPPLLGTVIILGDEAAPASYIIDSVAATASAVGSASATIHVKGCTLRAAVAGHNPVAASREGRVITTNTRLVASAGNGVVATAAGQVSLYAGTAFVGGGTEAIRVGGGGIIDISGAISFGAGAWSTVALVTSLGNIQVAPAGSVGTTGAVTGKRFDCTSGGVINTLGAGVNFFPGSIAGTTQETWQYV